MNIRSFSGVDDMGLVFLQNVYDSFRGLMVDDIYDESSELEVPLLVLYQNC